MANLFQLNIYTPEKTIYEGQVSILDAPGEVGYLEVLAHHAAFVTNLVPGLIRFKDESGKTAVIRLAGKGFLEVIKNNVTLLLNQVE